MHCRAKEADLAAKLRDAQVAAQAAADAAAAKEAELQLARQQLEAEKAKGLPVEQEIEKHRKQVQEKVSPPLFSHFIVCKLRLRGILAR